MSDIREAIFQARPNRFVIECRVDGRLIRASLPNPGRMMELLYPGVRLLITKSTSETAALAYRALAVYRDGSPIMLDTLMTNRVIDTYLRNRAIPGLKTFELIRREATYGKSRFDFLLRRGQIELFLEAKSCTLFGGSLAMFPDAVTQRGKKHILELAELRSKKRQGMVVFLVHWNKADCFLPDYHTDYTFSQALYRARKTVRILALSTNWSDDLSFSSQPRTLRIPWEIYQREAGDRGAYLVLLKCHHDMSINVGALGDVSFPQGYYIYVGSAMKNLQARIDRHRRKTKKTHWHIDYLSYHANFIHAFPIRTADSIECALADSIAATADWSIENFGCSDCRCASHLFGFKRDPRLSPAFSRILLYCRMERLLQAKTGL